MFYSPTFLFIAIVVNCAPGDYRHFIVMLIHLVVVYVCRMCAKLLIVNLSI